MSVHVMIKRKWQIDKPQLILPLLNKLHNGATKQPGYISGETLRNVEDPEDFLVISKWETADDWKRWFNSKERRDMQSQVDILIGEKTFYKIYENIN